MGSLGRVARIVDVLALCKQNVAIGRVSVPDLPAWRTASMDTSCFFSSFAVEKAEVMPNLTKDS